MKHRLRTKVFFYLYDNLRLFIYIFGCSAGGGDFWKVVHIHFRMFCRWRGFLEGGAAEGWFQVRSLLLLAR